MKYGYSCTCGAFNLKRGDKTRKQYAEAKRQHAETCEIMKKELTKGDRARMMGTGKRTSE